MDKIKELLGVCTEKNFMFMCTKGFVDVVAFDDDDKLIESRSSDLDNTTRIEELIEWVKNYE